MPNLPILITGAGPTGLMMACQLTRFHIDFRIIDKKSGPTDESRALAVQSRTLEIYDQMGVADEAVKQGEKARAVNFVVKGKKVQRVPLEDVGGDLSPYPYMHILEQSKNERILLKFLEENGRSVEWNTELINFTASEDHVDLTIANNGRQEKLQTSWLIGADGAGSIVRKKTGLDFKGGTYDQTFFVLDAAVEWGLGYHELFVCLTKKTFNAFFPMPGSKRYRIVGILEEEPKNDKDVNFEDLKKTVEKHFSIPVNVSDPAWHSIYRLHHRSVKHFRAGRCFLAGDSAHVHSPAGGQGMNTGLQDAYNLAWKLALVEKKSANPSLLDSYEEERLPFAKRLVKTTDRAFMMLVSRNPFIRFIRLNFLPHIMKVLLGTKKMQLFAYKTVSQININYRKSSISAKKNGNFPSSTPLPGDRFPYLTVKYNEIEQNIFNLFRSTDFHLLVFSKKREINEDIIPENLKKILKLHFISFEQNEKLYTTLGINDEAIFLVRPDMYLGFRSRNIEPGEWRDYLQSKLHLNLRLSQFQVFA